MLIVAAWYARLVRVGVSCGSDDDDEQHGDDEYGDHGVYDPSPLLNASLSDRLRLMFPALIVFSVI